MAIIENLNVTVTIEGDGDADEIAFAKLFDKYARLRDEKMREESSRARQFVKDRALYSIPESSG